MAFKPHTQKIKNYFSVIYLSYTVFKAIFGILFDNLITLSNNNLKNTYEILFNENH